jgi:hypothetical protein
LAEGAAARRALALIAALPGVVAAKPVSRETVAAVAREEQRCVGGMFVQVRNLGLETALRRQVVFAVLKDRAFRPPPAPTVYLVEESEPAGVPPRQRLRVGERHYRILGEEVLSPGQVYAEKTVPLGDSFVLFAQRRSSSKRPSYFIVPPLGFAELEVREAELGITRVFSISPSAPADALLRRLCGFAEDAALATLLVGFDVQA